MDRSGGYIYAMSLQDTPFIKIGTTRHSVQKRLAMLQSTMPFELAILVTIPVSAYRYQIETYIHKALAAQKHRGEWFRGPIEVQDLLDLVRQAEAMLSQHITGHIPNVYCRQQFIQRVRQQQYAHEYTDQELELTAGLVLGTLQQLERGAIEEVSGQATARLARILGVSTDYFLVLSDHISSSRAFHKNMEA